MRLDELKSCFDDSVNISQFSSTTRLHGRCISNIKSLSDETNADCRSPGEKTLKMWSSEGSKELAVVVNR